MRVLLFSAAVVLYIVNMVLMVFSVCFSLILVVPEKVRVWSVTVRTGGCLV